MNGWMSGILMLWDMGIVAGLMLGGMLLLRPVLLRLLTARQRTWLGMLGWYGTGMINLFSVLGWVHILPVTFRDLITPRTTGRTANELPAYLPVDYRGTGEYVMALPGGKAVWVELTDWMVLAVTLVWLAGIAALSIWMWRRSRRLKALGRQGELLAPKDSGLKWLQEDRDTAVRLCRGLPTSFVYQGGEKIDGKRYDMIYLQAELPPQRRELACDERTLRDLAGPEERKQYAQTLVELASGKMLWGEPLAFGECGAVARVKAAVAWHKPRWWVKLGKWCAFVLLFLFFVGGPRNIPFLPEDVVWKWQQADIEVELSGDWTPVERWMRVEQDGDMALLAKDTTGKWHKMSYWCSAWDGTFLRMSDWETMLGTPDLTGAQSGLW